MTTSCTFLLCQVLQAPGDRPTALRVNRVLVADQSTHEGTGGRGRVKGERHCKVAEWLDEQRFDIATKCEGAVACTRLDIWTEVEFEAQLTRIRGTADRNSTRTCTLHVNYMYMYTGYVCTMYGQVHLHTNVPYRSVPSKRLFL